MAKTTPFYDQLHAIWLRHKKSIITSKFVTAFSIITGGAIFSILEPDTAIMAFEEFGKVVYCAEFSEDLRCYKDSDGDGVVDVLEIHFGTNPWKVDSNGNGILDGDEDSNNDGFPDKNTPNPFEGNDEFLKLTKLYKSRERRRKNSNEDIGEDYDDFWQTSGLVTDPKWIDLKYVRPRATYRFSFKKLSKDGDEILL